MKPGRCAVLALAGILPALAGCAPLAPGPWSRESAGRTQAADPGTAAGAEARDPPGRRPPRTAADPDPVHRPDRRDYVSFRESQPDVLEPNYLPFMVHRAPRAGPAGDLLFFCRWYERDMPLEVFVEAPRISEALQDEFHPTDPRFFAVGVEHALRVWERELEGLVTFRLVDRPELARLRIRLLGERAPVPRPDVVVLGATRALLSGCRVDGADPDSDGLHVSFDVPEVLIYVADEHGLLTTGQVERIALHELGHALGMLGHSPNPGDMMFASYRERSAVETLSQGDINSFVSLYRLPNGALYASLPPGGLPPPLPPWPPSGPPILAPAPQVDALRGFKLRVPAGWLAVESPRGLFAANGPVWDYDASIELAVWPYATLEELLVRYFDALFEDSWLRARGPTQLAGKIGERVIVEDDSGSQLRDFRFFELGDGRLLMIVAQAPIEAEAGWAPWFDAALATLEVWAVD